jgi:hypothetical protein
MVLDLFKRIDWNRMMLLFMDIGSKRGVEPTNRVD